MARKSPRKKVKTANARSQAMETGTICFVWLVSLGRSMKRYRTTNGIAAEVAQTSMKRTTFMTIPILSDTVTS
jgi:hypothetical protein